MFRSKKIAVLVAGAVAALALGSFAFAAIPDGGGVIHGCYNTTSGAMRVTDSDTSLPKGCSSKETALNWNQQGPKGDRGPSNAYWTEGNETLAPNTWTVVATRTVPPGLYVVSGKLSLKASGLNVPLTTVVCGLNTTGGSGGTSDYAYGSVSSDALSSLARPQSITTISPNGPTSTLLGLRSRCSTPR